MKKYCYINGKITEEKNACINPHDLGILRGYGVFDFMCTVHRKPFLLHDHWIRLRKSGQMLNLTMPINKKEFIIIIEKLLQKNSYKIPTIRTVLTAGVSTNGITLPQKPTLYILIHDMDQSSPDTNLYHNGAKVITHNFARDNYISKTTNYIEAIKLQKEKNRHNAIEILYIHKNAVLECATSNIFIIKNNKLLTPKDNILHGITRKLVLRLAQKNNIATKEQKITKQQLLAADEVFITGSAKHILPITKINTTTINTGLPGQLTHEMTKLYFDYLNHYNTTEKR